MSNFKNRVFGCVMVKALNASYNADFSQQPRRLPNGTVYATDKVLKYSIRNYFKQALGERVFYFSSHNKDFQPRNLDETYAYHFDAKTAKDKKKVLENLFTCLDVRLFGGTYASKNANLSIHGSCQITPALNRFPEQMIYSEQIMSPFRNSSKSDSMQTTLGTQSRLQEGHYVHHFSLNPKNIESFKEQLPNLQLLSQEDVRKLKEALRRGVTYYDSASKIGCENELMIWLELKEGEQMVLPSFVELIEMTEDKVLDLSALSRILQRPDVLAATEKLEIYTNIPKESIKGLMEHAQLLAL
ncbi:uncharacterized protein predicted to be involved in DNA repair [Saprospira grandis DSM 2844]|uniref:Uncharacterized protein predicted to be involved in DNA repair n=1 Tax=Saprospira grandis DSM 2844 TaxID=694433 RepID=J0P408_9BACT|nr:type I CRISPR-associated protein Cas7 [Saprospira grandis]EJF52127.1 uncharacterized protein predicted to be involved in DNA repair [Saprospira grandis DSM 2844]